MTEPAPPPPPLDPNTGLIWCCSCAIHQATNHKPVCPVCLDDEVREGKR